MNNAGVLFLLALGVLLLVIVFSKRGRDAVDVALGRKQVAS